MFYDKLSKICAERKTSPTAVAKELGLSTGAPNRWVNGGKPHRSTLLKISEYFGVEPSYFDETAPEPATAPAGAAGGNREVIARFAVECSEEEAAYVAQSIRMLKAARTVR